MSEHPAQGLAALHDDFATWAGQRLAAEGVDVPAGWAGITQLTEIAARDAALSDCRRWEAQHVGAVVEAVRRAEVTPRRFALLLAWLSFLRERDHWSGTPQEWAVALHLAADADDAFLDDAVRDVPVLRHLDALVRWVSPRLTVTRGGALRPADLHEAAACVGVDLRVSRPTKMTQVAHLPEVWRTAVASGLVDVAGTVATVGHPGTDWLTDTSPSGPPARLAAVLASGATVLSRPSLSEHSPPPGVVLGPGLAALASGAALTAADLEEALVRACGVRDLSSALGQMLRVDGLGPLEGLVEQLVRDGLLTASAPAPGAERLITVRPGLERVVGLLARSDLRSAAETRRPAPTATRRWMPDRRANTSGTAPGSRAGTRRRTALALRIDITGARPPIWRRVLVAQSASLADLHEVIQAVFGWHGYHLHSFTVDGWEGGERTFEPHDQIEAARTDGFPNASSDEARARLRTYLPSPGDRLEYTYDFGDDWTHRVVLEDVVTTDQPLPCAIAGRRAAPAEDSGGVWGWEEVVEAVNDPDHPDHEQMLAWMSLEEGQRLDAAAFDLGAADLALDRLRHPKDD